jgi:hypothetical protein
LVGIRSEALANKIPGLCRLDNPGSKRTKARFQNSIHHTFRTEVLPEISTVDVAKSYSRFMGRPSHDITMMAGLVILQSVHDWTNEQTVKKLNTDLEVQYALKLDDVEQDTTMIGLRTYMAFKKKFLETDSAALAFYSVTLALMRMFNCDTSIIRIDSTYFAPRT